MWRCLYLCALSLLLVLCLVGCDTAESDTIPDGDGSEVDDSEAEGYTEPERNFAYTEERASCDDYNPYRNLYFGDLHAHSRLSWDAYGYDMRVQLADAYAFAKGGSVLLPPLEEDGIGSREVKNYRPLDFVGMSDHIEFVGEYRLCTTEGSPAYDSESCTKFREGGQGNVTQFGLRLATDSPKRMADICGEDGVACRDAAKESWKAMRDAAESAYDKRATCGFTTFPAYEYTGSPGIVNFHRNVLFRNATVPELPPSFFEEPTPKGLWAALENGCNEAGSGCETMVIPHNSNWSNGHMFTPATDADASREEKVAWLKARSEMERVAEVFQHKGDMECKNGFDGIAFDDFCEFEKIREAEFDDCGEKPGWGGVNGFGCLHKLDYLRNVFKFGLELRREFGFNPYKFSVIGSTDTHNGMPGGVAEWQFPGHVGLVDDTAEKRLGDGTLTHNPRMYNPGGLAAVWAQENSRDAIFSALQNGETYATSGPRISLRIFGGWEFSAGLCDSPEELVKEGYGRGVPMGGDLPVKPEAVTAPVFYIQARMDPGTEAHPGTPLQVLQVIKGWIDADGQTHEKIYEVAGNSLNGARVDEVSCERSGEGEESFCVEWADPEFDSAQEAFYYARAVENPTCRWTAYDCADADPANKPDGCSASDIPKTQQERAWTTPIWYEAAGE